MKYSKLFGKTVREAKRDMQTASHKLLYQAGFIRESVAGRYYFLPLGMRVRDKIMKVIEEEMDRAGAQKMITPVLHPLELWQETNRTSTTGFELMKVKDRRGDDFVLGGTAEEMIVDLVRGLNLSYKDLPFNIYQFSTKFRDELRARGGLLRTREFTMKDAYSFHTDEEDFAKEYEKMRETYIRIYKRLGLEAKVVEADNGYIGGDYCHELIVDSEVGESTYFESEDGSYISHEDKAKFLRDDINSKDKELPFEIIEQPEWVQTMEDNKKHYGLPVSRFLKNVVYKSLSSGEIIIAVMRGDMEVNKTKLEQVLGLVGQLVDATDADLAKLGTKSGYVHSWGHKGARYIGDISLTTVKNFVGGQKEETTDSINVNYGRDFECDFLADIALAKDGFLTENGKQKLIAKKGIEVGNIFQLGTYYSSKMTGATFTDQDGKEKQYYMGCYGIGIERTLATIVEKYNDERGIIWPEVVAPYKYHLVSLTSEKEGDTEVLGLAEKVYKALGEENVLWDERKDVNPGAKFADADLIGCPIRLVVSSKSLTAGGIEVKRRNEEKAEIVKLDELINSYK